MTAFDNIKTNNWPSSTTDPFEDFCVLKLPLNNQASLTESLPVVVGSQDLFPKRTLTNTGGVSIEYARVQPDYGATGFTKSTNWRETNYAAPETGLFNGDGTSTQAAIHGDNVEHWFEFATPLTNVTKVETRMGYDGQQTARAYMGNGTTAFVYAGAHATFFTVYSGAATTFSKIGWRSNNGSGASVYDIRITDDTGTYVLTSNENLKKHYDNNAVFSSSVLTMTAPVPRGGASRTLEFWAYLNSGASSWQNIISYGSSGDSQCFGINRGNSDTSNIAFTGYSNGDWNTGTSVASYLDTWTHFSVSYDSGTVEIFLNGTSIGTASRTLNTGGSTFVVGGSEHSGNNERFSGKIQDVRVYNKKIRTANFTPPGAILT